MPQCTRKRQRCRTQRCLVVPFVGFPAPKSIYPALRCPNSASRFNRANHYQHQCTIHMWTRRRLGARMSACALSLSFHTCPLPGADSNFHDYARVRMRLCTSPTSEIISRARNVLSERYTFGIGYGAGWNDQDSAVQGVRAVVSFDWAQAS